MNTKLGRVIRTLFHRTTSEDMLHLLNKVGVTVGSHTVFFAPSFTEIDIQRPWLVEIGDYCKITKGVVILAHDYSRSVLRRVYGEVIGEARKTVIGDNVFVGMNSIILMGTHIGDNVIVGAGSVVHGNIPPNTVIAGNPARVICTLEEYYQKRKKACVDEAVENANAFREQYGRWPTEKEMGAFFPLYSERSVAYLKEKGIHTHLSGDDEDDIVNCFLHSMPQYANYEEFIAFVRNKDSASISWGDFK